MSVGSDGFYEASRQGESMDSLADELADAWDDGGGGHELGSSFLEGLREGSLEPSAMEDNISSGNRMQNGGFYGTSSPASPMQMADVEDTWHSPIQSSGNSKKSPNRRHKRDKSRHESVVDDSQQDCGNLDAISPSLSRELAAIESLARQGLNEDAFSEAGGVVSRTTTLLKDLGPQASLENGATRIATAYTSMANHRAHKPREILNLAQSLLFARSFSLSEEETDSLVSEIDLLIEHLHLPTGLSPLQPLHALITSTADLVHSLRSVADIIQESHQGSSTAFRRLKNVQALVTELRQEEEAREEAIRYLERGEWDQRIRSGQAASICGEVVTGFEATCDEWRDRLLGMSTAAVTPA